jgi:Lon protease-like protein
MLSVPAEIPLLPLPAVLFPGTFLPVQLHDEGHRALVRECVDRSEQLGVVLAPGDAGGARASVPCTTGCLATVALLLYEDEHDQDQPISVVLYGERRMRVVDFVQQDPYLTGHVELLDDYSGQQAERRIVRATALFERYLDLVRQRYDTDVVNLPLPNDPIMASYLLASVLYLPLETKQRWLESASAVHRLDEQLAYLDAECDKLAMSLQLSQFTHHVYTIPDHRLYVRYVGGN